MNTLPVFTVNNTMKYKPTLQNRLEIWRNADFAKSLSTEN